MPIAEVEVSLLVLVICKCTNAGCLCKSTMVETYKSEVGAYNACVCGRSEAKR